MLAEQKVAGSNPTGHTKKRLQSLFFYSRLCYNGPMQWDLITTIIVITAILTMGAFAVLGLYQWITRKSIKKVDRRILCMLIPLVLIVITYFVFDKLFILNTRPDGSGEPSFPSTHTMIAATIFFVVMMALPKYVKNKNLRIVLDIIMVILVGLTATGRVLANKHWPIDVIGGIAFGIVFSEIYYYAVHFKKAKK